MGFRRDVRQHGDAKTGFHHEPDPVEACDIHALAEDEAERLGLATIELLQGHRPRQADERLDG